MRWEDDFMDVHDADTRYRESLSRRRFLSIAAAGFASAAATSLLAACGGTTSSPAATPTAARSAPSASAIQATAAGAASSASAASPQAAQTGSPMAGKKGGVLHVVYAEEPKNLHPQIDSGTEGVYVGKQIYDGMVNIDANGKIIPGLATNLPEHPDELTYIFHLRKDVIFHNGKPFRADDVVWTFDRLMGKFPNLASTQAARFKQQIARVEKVDDSTVKIVLTVPWPDFLPLMAGDKYMDIMQQDAEEANPKEYGQTIVVGTGPFMFKEWIKGDHITLVRNDKYWGTPAYVDQIVYKATPEEATRMSSLAAGEIDILFAPALKDVKKYESDPKFRVQTSDAGNMKIFVFNTTKMPFTDVRVRQALAYGIDRQEIVDAIYYGYATVGQDILPPWNPSHDPSKTYYPYDAEKAKKLLADAGYNQSKPLGFELLTTNVTEFTDLSTLIQAQLQRIGVKVTITPLDKSAFTAKIFPQGNTANPGFQADVYRLIFGFATSDYTWRTYHPNSALDLSGYNQPGGAQDPAVPKLLDQAIQATDPQKEKALYGQCSDLISQDMPMLLLGFQKNVNISRADVKNLGITVINNMPLKDVFLDR